MTTTTEPAGTERRPVPGRPGVPAHVPNFVTIRTIGRCCGQVHESEFCECVVEPYLAESGDAACCPLCGGHGTVTVTEGRKRGGVPQFTWACTGGCDPAEVRAAIAPPPIPAAFAGLTTTKKGSPS
jgi:hypothetical protein